MATEVLSISGSSFSATAGKLSTANRYIKKTSRTPDIYFVLAQNMDVKNGGLRYITGDGTTVDDGQYDGTFTTTAGIGMKLT